MTRQLLPSLFLLATLAACGNNSDTDEPTLDSTPAEIAIDVPENPRVSSIDIGLAVAPNGTLLGGGTEQFQGASTLFVGVRTQFVDAGAPMTVRLMQASRIIETVSLVAGAPDEDQFARAHAELTAAGTLDPGEYQVEVMLGDVSQGIRNITLTQAP